MKLGNLKMWLIILCLILQIIYAENITAYVDRISSDALERKAKYTADWSDLDKRPLPRWYDAAKIGIFVHWGLYSVPAFKNEWFWHFWIKGDKQVLEFLENEHYNGTYTDFAPLFTAELFDPDAWAELFAKAGAKYVVFTTKHHDGFALFPSSVNDFNSVKISPKRDLVEAVASSVRKYNMKFGVYYSLYEWFNKLWLYDKRRKFKTFKYVENIPLPDIKQLINDYKPSVLWLDGEWEAPDDYWKSADLLSWIYNESPVKDEIVVNDRLGSDTRCHHGDFYNCDDRFNPEKLMLHKWENAFTIDVVSWGFRRNMIPSDVLTINQLLENIVSTVSCGGNALVNIGPTKQGTIVPIFQERLTQLGEWLRINGEAIYSTSPWYHQKDSTNPNVWYTCKRTFNSRRTGNKPNKKDIIFAIYAIILKWPVDDLLKIADLTSYFKEKNYTITFLDDKNFTSLDHSITSEVLTIHLPSQSSVTGKYAWSLKISLKRHG